METAQTVGRVRETWTEVLFWMSVFFGGIHMTGVVCDIAGQAWMTRYGVAPAFAMKSSLLFGNLYLMSLLGYVGRKEMQRWQSLPDTEVLSKTLQKKISRGLIIIIAWAAVTGIAGIFLMKGWITEVPQPLLYTLGEVFVLYFGTDVAKYAKALRTAHAAEAVSYAADYGDRVVAIAKEKGSVNAKACIQEFGMSRGQAYRLLDKLRDQGRLVAHGKGKSTYYTLP